MGLKGRPIEAVFWCLADIYERDRASPPPLKDCKYFRGLAFEVAASLWPSPRFAILAWKLRLLSFDCLKLSIVTALGAIETWREVQTVRRGAVMPERTMWPAAVYMAFLCCILCICPFSKR